MSAYNIHVCYPATSFVFSQLHEFTLTLHI